MKQKRFQLPSGHVLDKCAVLLFILSALLSLFTTYYVTSHFLDSDASSEMVLAQQLSETNQIMSMDWLYSTELRVLNSQLFFAFFFKFFNNWHTVRFCAAVLLQAILILTYRFMLREAGFHKRVFWIGASALLLPVSVTYGRIILYHSHYIVHLALAFLIVGIIIGFADGMKWGDIRTYLRLALLVGCSFVGGLAGVRHLMVIYAPLLLCIVLLSFVNDSKNSDVQTASILHSQNLRLLLVSGLATVCSLIGVIINSTILSKYYSFSEYADTTLGILDFSRLSDVFYGLFHQFGFRKEVSLLTVMGILSVGGIITGTYCLFIGIKQLLHYEEGQNIKKAIINSFLVCFTAVMLIIFLLTGKSGDYYYVLYLSFCFPWAITPLIVESETFLEKVHPLNVRRIFYWCAILFLIFNILVNIAFFNGSEKFDQHYEGINFFETDFVEQKTDVITFLEDNGYTIGYATYWEGNVMTEISNGRIRMINLSMDHENGNLQYYNWLTSLYLREIPNEMPFILISQQEKAVFEKSDSFEFCQLIYEDNYQRVYQISRLDEFISTLYY